MKLLEEGAVVLAMSDSRGYVYQEEGLTRDQVQQARRPRRRLWSRACGAAHAVTCCMHLLWAPLHPTGATSQLSRCQPCPSSRRR